MPAATAVAWKECAWTIGERIFYSFAALVALAFAWMINYWNLLDYRIV